MPQDKNILYSNVKIFKFIINIKSKIDGFVTKFCDQTPKSLLQKQNLSIYLDDCG